MTSDATSKVTQQKIGHPAGFGRRLGAMFYDGLLLVAIWASTVGLLVVTTGQAVTPWASQVLAVMTYFGFFGYFWAKQGQSLGMLAWHIKLVTAQGKNPTLASILLRLAVAIASMAALGVGYFWLWTNDNRQTWHGIASNTLIVHLPKV